MLFNFHKFWCYEKFKHPIHYILHTDMDFWKKNSQYSEKKQIY